MSVPAAGGAMAAARCTPGPRCRGRLAVELRPAGRRRDVGAVLDQRWWRHRTAGRAWTGSRPRAGSPRPAGSCPSSSSPPAPTTSGLRRTPGRSPRLPDKGRQRRRGRVRPKPLAQVRAPPSLLRASSSSEGPGVEPLKAHRVLPDLSWHALWARFNGSACPCRRLPLDGKTSRIGTRACG